MFGRTTIYSGSSQYGSYKIVDEKYNGRRARVLYGDNHTPQSGVALDDDPELLFHYNQRFMEIIASLQPKRLLVIGGGVMMLPIAVHERFDDISIDVVEIDGLLVDLARQYFNAPNGMRLRTHVADGKKFLESSSARYDVIVIDAFSGHDIPKHLLEKSASDLYEQHLTEDGILAINLISAVQSARPRLVTGVLATLEETFSHTGVYQADSDESLREEQNLIVVAGNGEVDFDYIQSIDVRHDT